MPSSPALQCPGLKRGLLLTAPLVLAALLTACGGKGGSAAPAAQGVPLPPQTYYGNIADSGVYAAFLTDGSFWAFSSSRNTLDGITEVYKGTALNNNGAFTASGITAYTLPFDQSLPFNGLGIQDNEAEPAHTAQATGTFDPVASTIDGTFTFNSQSAAFHFNSFALTDPGTPAPSITQIQGAYLQNLSSTLNTPQTQGQNTIQITIDATGAIKGGFVAGSGGAPAPAATLIQGSVTPRTDIQGFDLSLAFVKGAAGSASPLEGLRFQGLAFYRSSYYDPGVGNFAFIATSSDGAQAIGFSAALPTPDDPAVRLLPVAVHGGTMGDDIPMSAAFTPDGSFWLFNRNATDQDGITQLQMGTPTTSNGHLSGTATGFALPYNLNGTLVPDAVTITSSPILADLDLDTNLLDGRFGAPGTPLRTAFSIDLYDDMVRHLGWGNPVIAAVAGPYAHAMSSTFNVPATLGQDQLSISIDATTGAITGTYPPASTTDGQTVVPVTVTGTLTPRTDLNAFDLTLSFAQANTDNPSPFDGLSFTGIAIYTPQFYDVNTANLTLLAVSGDQTNALAFSAPAAPSIPPL